MNDEQGIPAAITFTATMHNRWSFLSALAGEDGALLGELVAGGATARDALSRYGIHIQGKDPRLVDLVEGSDEEKQARLEAWRAGTGATLDPDAIRQAATEAQDVLLREAGRLQLDPNDPGGDDRYGDLLFQLDNETIFLRMGLPWAMPFVAVDEDAD